jgi:hypothetical protein
LAANVAQLRPQSSIVSNFRRTVTQFGKEISGDKHAFDLTRHHLNPEGQAMMKKSPSKKPPSINGAARIAAAAALATLMVAASPPAQARDCSVAIPSGQTSHWSYRIVDGRKCWYPGSNNLSKALLAWPKDSTAQASMPSRPAAARETAKKPAPSDPGAALHESGNFEQRWRALERRAVN